MTTTPVPPLPEQCWPVDHACLGDTWDQYDEDTQARADALAVQTLRALTGYRVGGCPVVLRPCRRSCLPQVPTYREYPVVPDPSGGGLGVAYIGGVWFNMACGCTGDCSCTRICEVRLPAGQVHEVRVDGYVLDPSAWRVDYGNVLVRLDGECWPLCQDMSADDNQAGTWSVTFTPGQRVDALGSFAAGILAGEFAKACSGASCRLPAGVTQLARGGVTMTLAGDSFPEGMTGIREVDAFIRRWNPNHLTQAPAVWSPDLRRPRRVGTASPIPTPGPGGFDFGGACE
ncbi:MAG: hypothetical protein FWG11_08750 [Promicromonosporaceae bacterium]|nr:hypothetical protein [Promicromonosporaceae bacterium]